MDVVDQSRASTLEDDDLDEQWRTGVTKKHRQSRAAAWSRFRIQYPNLFDWASIVRYCESYHQGTQPIKESTRLGILIKILTEAHQQGFTVCNSPQLKEYKKTLELRLVREIPKKAPILTADQLRQLCKTQDFAMQVPLALILPTGARFADAARIRRADIVRLQRPCLTYRVFQTKTIRSRKHQRWATIVIPSLLWDPLIKAIASTPPSEPLITTSYDRFLRFLKTEFGPATVTYSLRRGVFEQMRLRATCLEDITAITFHRSTDQLRWYLEAPLPDEERRQKLMTAWHAPH